jgi:hypothetical protein
VFSSWKPSKKLSKSSSALSILSAYSPIIQIIDALGNTAKTTVRYENVRSLYLTANHHQPVQMPTYMVLKD